MNVQDAYLSFLEKVNQNNTNDNISADKGRFVTIYNEEQNRYVEWLIEKRNVSKVHDIQKILVKDKVLDFGSKKENVQNFLLPKNFFSFVNIKGFAGNGVCSNQPMLLFEVKPENVHELLADDNNKPSFEFRESFYTISSDSVNVYVENFSLEKLLLTYYRYPVQVDIAGYIKSNGKASKNIDPEFDDKVVDRIITACAKAFNVNNDNLQRFQLDRDRLYSSI